MPQFELIRYLTSDGTDVFGAWFGSLRDERAKARIRLRIDRLSHGGFGDCKPLQKGVWELRVDYGGGYRVYYSLTGKTILLLLCGGDKRTQTADITRATAFLADYKKRTQA